MGRKPEVTFDDAIATCDRKIDTARDLGTGGEAFESIWLRYRQAYIQARDRLRGHAWKVGEWVELRRGAGAQWARVGAVTSGELFLCLVVSGDWHQSTNKAPRWGSEGWYRKDNARLVRVADKPPFHMGFTDEQGT